MRHQPRLRDVSLGKVTKHRPRIFDGHGYESLKYSFKYTTDNWQQYDYKYHFLLHFYFLPRFCFVLLFICFHTLKSMHKALVTLKSTRDTEGILAKNTYSLVWAWISLLLYRPKIKIILLRDLTSTIFNSLGLNFNYNYNS